MRWFSHVNLIMAMLDEQRELHLGSPTQADLARLTYSLHPSVPTPDVNFASHRCIGRLSQILPSHATPTAPLACSDNPQPGVDGRRVQHRRNPGSRNIGFLEGDDRQVFVGQDGDGHTLGVSAWTASTSNGSFTAGSR